MDPETGETTNAYGTSEGFTDSAPGEPQELDSDSGALPEPDPSGGHLSAASGSRSTMTAPT